METKMYAETSKLKNMSRSTRDETINKMRLVCMYLIPHFDRSMVTIHAETSKMENIRGEARETKQQTI